MSFGLPSLSGTTVKLSLHPDIVTPPVPEAVLDRSRLLE